MANDNLKNGIRVVAANGNVYNVLPSAVGATELNVTAPDDFVTVTATPTTTRGQLRSLLPHVYTSEDVRNLSTKLNINPATLWMYRTPHEKPLEIVSPEFAILSGGRGAINGGLNFLKPGSTFWNNPITKQIAASELGGQAVDATTAAMTPYKSWAEGISAATGIPEWAASLTNPGYMLPYRNVAGVVTRNGKNININDASFKPRPKMIRLYRATGTNGNFEASIDGGQEFAGLWFTNNMKKPQMYASYTVKRAKRLGINNPIELLYVDIPENELSKYKASEILKGRTDIEYEPTEDFLIPLNYPRQRIPLEGYTGNLLLDSKKVLPELNKPFKSSLDWSPESWFGTRATGGYDAEDVAALQSHLPEYIDIEKKAKANDTWLKMPDGSTWQGDPRSWVQMLSKAYKEANLSNEALYHGDSDLYITREGIDLTPEEVGKKVLWTSTNHYIPGTYGNKLYVLSIPQNTPISTVADAKGRYWRDVLPNTNTNTIVYPNLTNDIAVRINNVVDRGPLLLNRNILPKSLPGESVHDYSQRVFLGDDIVLGKNVKRKSLLGNNGDFNLNKRNIFKGLIFPIGLGTTLYTQSKKKGGNINIKKENKGKFTDYCNGKVTNKCILKGKHSSNPAIRKRAVFAENARHFKHKFGGMIYA